MLRRTPTAIRAAAVGGLCALFALGPARAEEAGARDAGPQGGRPGESGPAARPATRKPAKAAAPATTPAPWLRKSSATLAVESKVAGATVLVDGREVGKTPLKPLRLEPGSHEVKLVKVGFADAARKLKLGPGARVRVTLDLLPVPATDALLAALPAPPPIEVDEEGPGRSLKGTRAEKQGAGAAAVAELPLEEGPPPLVTAAGELAGAPAPPREGAIAALPVAPPSAVAPVAPPAPVAAVPERPGPPAPAAAVAVAPAPVETPLVKRWWFWGGAAAAAAVLVAGVVYALPAQYAEKRDPAAACGAAGCGVIVNK